MDSLTQIVLGAAVGEVVLGKKLGNRAIFWGAVAGTIPDLDVLANPFVDDELTATLMHRAFTHSFLFCFLMAPVFGYLISRLFRKQRNIYKGQFENLPYVDKALHFLNRVFTFFFRESKANFRDWTLLFFWGFLTHILLDAQTTYGTQLFWPIHNRVALSNIFVVDPLYTLPFLLLLIIVMFIKRTNPWRVRMNRVALYISTGYLLLTFIFKGIAYFKFTKNLEMQGITYSRIETGPTPLNSILWYANVETEDHYYTGYYSLLDKNDSIPFKKFTKRHDLRERFRDYYNFKRMNGFSKDWYVFTEENDTLYYNNMRFGTAGFEVEDRDFVFRERVEIVNDDLQFKTEIKDFKEDTNSDESPVKQFFEILINRIKGKQ